MEAHLACPLARFVIPGNPAIKKNNRPIFKNRATGVSFVGKSPRLKVAELDALEALLKQRIGIGKLPFDFPLHVKFTFYRQDKRHCDLSNLVELPADALQAAGIILNDYLIESLDGSRKYVDPENPRTEIEIYPFIATRVSPQPPTSAPAQETAHHSP